MAITLAAKPDLLTWADFRLTTTKPVDPGDGTSVDAFTTFSYDVPDLDYSTVDGQLAYTGTATITITPNAEIFQSAPQTAGLLSHEQFHYDVGIVTGRALARSLMALRAPNAAALQQAHDAAIQLHFMTRAGLLQHHYDRETQHGADAHYQKVWKDSMAVCLADPLSLHLLGFWL